jgi:hypothetical protein
VPSSWDPGLEEDMTFCFRDGLVYKLEGGGTIGAEFLELPKPEDDQDPPSVSPKPS